MTTDNDQDERFFVELTAEIVSAYIGNNPVASDGLPALIADVNRSLKGLQHLAEPVVEKKPPAVSIKKSRGEERLICLEDGKSFKSLKRHLNTHHGLTPSQYREKWGSNQRIRWLCLPTRKPGRR